MEESAAQMLDQALTCQRRSVKFFELMILVAPTEERPLLQALRREDRRHFYLLEGIYEDICGSEWRRPHLSLALPKQFSAMLQVMICDKLDMIEYYCRLDEALDCAKQRELVDIVIADQREQVRLLAAVYKHSFGA